ETQSNIADAFSKKQRLTRSGGERLKRDCNHNPVHRNPMDFKRVENVSDILRHTKNRLCGREPSRMAAGAAHNPRDFDFPGRQLRHGLEIGFSESGKAYD